MAEAEAPIVRNRPTVEFDGSQYMHISQAQARENELLDEISRLQGISDRFDALSKLGDPDKLSKRVQELEGKVRSRAHRDAYEELRKELKIKDEFADDVFDLAKFAADKDEPDKKAMKLQLKEFLDARESRKSYIDAAEEGEAKGDQPAPAKPKLHSEEEGRGNPTSGTRFRYRSEDLSNPDWMRNNGVAYAKAVAAGNALKIG